MAFGAIVGVIAGVLGCVLFARLGWYDMNIRFARALRWITFILTVGSTAVVFGVIGLLNWRDSR